MCFISLTLFLFVSTICHSRYRFTLDGCACSPRTVSRYRTCRASLVPHFFRYLVSYSNCCSVYCFTVLHLLYCARGGFSSRCGQSSFERHRVQFSVAVRDSAGAPMCAGVVTECDGIMPPSTIPTPPTARRPVNATEHRLSASARIRRRPDERRRIAVYQRQCWLCSLLYLSTLRPSFRPRLPLRRHHLSSRFITFFKIHQSCPLLL